MKSILVATLDPSVISVIRDCFGHEYKIEVVHDKAACIEIFRKNRFEFTFIDIEFLNSDLQNKNGPGDYRKELKPFWDAFPTAEIIIMSSQKMIREAVNLVKAGASNYLTYPLDPEEVKYVTESILELNRMQYELDYLRDRFWQTDSLELIKTNSPKMKQLLDKIKSVAPTRTTVLLSGETGTGKGLLARLIHHHSNRRDEQFISVHCGAIPDTLLESELFGHEKGAFTGAVKRKLGKFEIAKEGTIFLDEIGTITQSAQVKLLQVLQERTFQRIGAETPIRTDARILVATNSDLKQMTEEGSFRKDLYYRINVFAIEVPPLRERMEDIPLLAEVFMSRLNKYHVKEIRDIRPEVMEAFQEYSWPGNIREMENLMERAYILETSHVLTPESFPSELFQRDAKAAQLTQDTSLTLAEMRRKFIENCETNYIRELLIKNKGRVSESAKDAGISNRQFHKLLSRYGIHSKDFK